MKKGLIKTLAAVAALIVALPCVASPVLANSGPSHEYGVTSSGVIVRNENSVLAVESEKLTFDIVDLPPRSEESEYKSTVTAEYKFVNTSSDTVHTSMAFPMKTGERHRYGDGDFQPVISVDGQPVECVTRYTEGNYTDFDEGVKLISDEWYSDGFYSADLPVTKYTVSVSNPNGYAEAYVSGDVKCDKSKARLIINGNNMKFFFNFENDDKGNTFYSLNTPDKEKCFYVLGDSSACTFKWETYAGIRKNANMIVYEEAEIPYTISAESGMTLKELILSARPEDSAIIEIDYYNAVVRRFGEDKYCGKITDLNFKTDNALTWYAYDVEVAPNGSFTNKITAPIFPTTYYRYEPYVYEYEYYLSPAAKWASFGNLEVRVNSEYYMINPPKGFEKCEGGYRAEFSSLPKGELKFSISTSESPESIGRNSSMVLGIVMLVILCIICIVVPLAVFMPFIVKAAKKRRAEKKLDFSSEGD